MTRGTRGFIGGLEILPPFSVEEERSLYPVIQEGRSASAQIAANVEVDPARRRQLLRARQEGQEAESLLLRATFGLVRARVLERGYRFYNEDLEAAGVEGLINALQRFDPSKGNRFATYANYWIVKLVNQTVQQQAGLSDAEMRLILKFQRFERSHLDRRLSKKEVAHELGISQAKAQETMQLSRELQTRRFASAELEDLADPRPTGEINEAPAWVIEELRRLTGTTSTRFGSTRSRQWLWKRSRVVRNLTTRHVERIERSRRAVKESPEAGCLQRWFDQQ